MRSLALFAVVLSFTFQALAVEQVSLKDRVKWSMWIEGVEEFQAPTTQAQAAEKPVELPEEVTRVLLKYQL